MSLSLYWMPISQPARAVAWALSHEGVEFESINVMPGKETRVRPLLRPLPLCLCCSPRSSRL